MFRQYRLQDFRLRLVVLVYAITILGILVIGSAAEEYQSQQLLGMILGTVAMLVLTLMDYLHFAQSELGVICSEYYFAACSKICRV